MCRKTDHYKEFEQRQTRFPGKLLRNYSPTANFLTRRLSNAPLLPDTNVNVGPRSINERDFNHSMQ